MWRARLDSEALLTALDQLARKQRDGKHPRALLGGELPFGALGDQAAAFARELAGTIARGEYRFSPVAHRRALIDGKWRALYRAEPLDMIVTAALADALTTVLDPMFSERLYSYRQGRSAWQAIHAVVDHLASHRAQHPDPRTRGLYVLRRDIKAYGDSIPVDDDSALWGQLERAVQPDPATWTLLRQALRPTLAGTSEQVSSVPTGSALQPLMCNLYLTPVDDFALSVTGGFYARSGDDMVFMHPDASVARRVADEIERMVHGLRLSLSAEKTRNLYFTGAGRSSSVWSDAKGTTQLQYLGARIGFNGNVGLKAERARSLLHGLRRRLDNAMRLMPGEPARRRASVACEVVRAALDPCHPQCEPSVQLIVSAIDDRQQLRQLDYWVALDIAQRVTGISGPRAFRRLSYRALRREYGLPSLVVTRHRRGAA